MLFSSSTREVSFRAELPVGIVPLNPILSVWNNTGGQPFERQIPMTYLKKKHRLEAVISLPEESADQLPATFDTQVEFTCKKSGWRVQDTHLSSFGIAEHLPSSTLGAPPDAWFYMDFSGLSNGLCKKQLFPVGGKKGGLLWIEQTGGKAEAGGLDCKNLEAYAYPPQEMWDAIYSQGLRLQLEFRVDAPEQKTDYSSLFSYGTYSSGFRILLDSKNQVILQFAEGAEVGRPIRIRFPVAVSMGQWTSLELSVSPPDQQMQRVVRFRVGDAAQMVVPLVRDLVKSSSPVGLGIEFSSSDPIFPKKKTFSLFPGMIRKVSLEAYQAPIK